MCTQQHTRPHYRLTPPVQRTTANIRINLILPETSVPAERQSRRSMTVSLLVCTRFTSKTTISQAQHTGVKTEFNVKWPLRLFKVKCFAVSGKLTRDSISIYNNVGFISNGSVDINIMTESTENRRFS